MKLRNDRMRALALFALALLIYGFGISRAFVFDDVPYISENPLLRRSDAFRVYWFSSEAFNYYPLFWSLLRAQWLLWGDHPTGYHLVNLLLHGANAVLVWRIALAWRLPGAWWAAALFAVHPLNVQTVAWAAEQKNTWSFLFMALALLAYLRHARDGRWPGYAASLLCFAAALACKTSTVCLPVFLAVYFAFQRGPGARALLLRLLPFFALALAAGLTTIWFEEHRAAARSLMSTLSLWQRMEAAGAAFWFYLGKALVPLDLTPMYRGWVDTTAARHGPLPGVLLLALMAAGALAWRRIGAPVALGIVYYALMLLPLLGILDTNYFIYSQIADHWQYHALPGLLIAVLAAAGALARRWPRLALFSRPAGTAAVLGGAALASAHCAHFEDARSLWTCVAARNPEAWIAWYHLGNLHAADRAHPEAVAAYRRSLAIKPDYQPAHFNLGNALTATGDFAAAESAYLEAHWLRPDDPDVDVNFAVLLLRTDREDEAIGGFMHALRLEPRKTSAHVHLIVIFLRRGQIEEAAAHLEAAGVLNPANARRIAEAITGGAQQKGTARDVLRRFATRACTLNDAQPDLRAALLALEDAPLARP